MGILRKSGIITQSTALAMHNDNYHYPALEEYMNHAGAFDNAMVDNSLLSGSALSDSVNHRFNLQSGTGAISRGGIISAISIKPKSQKFDFRVKIQNIVNGATNIRNTCIGVMQAGAAQTGIGLTSLIGCMFIQTTDNLWSIYTNDGVSGQGSGWGSSPVAGDVLEIKGYKTRFEYFVNGVIVLVADRPFAADEVCYPQAYTSGDAAVTVAREIGIDFIGWRINP